jgi:hypothetical protein
VIVGQRQDDSNLAVVLLAQLAAILPRNAYRVLALPGKMIQKAIGPCRSIAGSTVSRATPSIGASLYSVLAARWCAACTRSGARRAAIGATLLRSPGSGSPVQ